jgi:hypothetical protein
MFTSLRLQFPVHQHYTFSCIEVVDAFMDELDPERRWGE